VGDESVFGYIFSLRCVSHVCWFEVNNADSDIKVMWKEDCNN